MDKVKVYFNSTSHHFSQLLSGLEFLNQKGVIKIEYVLDFGAYPGNIFKVNFAGLDLFFDLEDNSQINRGIYDKADLYVKRMLLKSDVEKLDKLVPYGLYYPVYYRNPFLKYLFLKDFKMLKYSLKYWPFLSSVLNMKDCIAVNGLSLQESETSKNDQIIFRARLWNPSNNNEEWKQKERKVLNDQRIKINRLLRDKFGDKFKGGIMYDDYAEQECPDLLLTKDTYHRRAYVKLMNNSGIGVVNQGLEDSIGAKFGEYVANSLAVVTTPIEKYQLLGNFTEGEHYLVYQNTEECLEMTRILFNNNSIRAKMQQANKEYYQEYLHPGQKLLKILAVVQNRKRNTYPSR